MPFINHSAFSPRCGYTRRHISLFHLITRFKNNNIAVDIRKFFNYHTLDFHPVKTSVTCTERRYDYTFYVILGNNLLQIAKTLFDILILGRITPMNIFVGKFIAFPFNTSFTTNEFPILIV